MRILHVTDFHFKAAWSDWLANKTPPCDIVCFSGDLVDVFGAISMDLQFRQVTSWLAEISLSSYSLSRVLGAIDLLRHEIMPAGKFDVLSDAQRSARHAHALAGIPCRFLPQGEFAFPAALDARAQG